MAYKRICYSDFKNCPCRLIDIKREISYCNFIPLFAESLSLDKETGSNKTESFLKKICPEVRSESRQHDVEAEQLQKQKKEFLEKVKPGDVVFCQTQLENVIFLEPPKTSYGYVKYKTMEGDIFESPGFCFRIISKGTKWAIYKTEDNDKADYYDYISRKNGFRVERHKVNNEYIIKIYGDTQKEVDEFVIQLENDLIINPYD